MSLEAWGDEGPESPFERAIEAGWIDPESLSKALIAVMNERQRQQDEEHFDPAHDDKHVNAELAQAAACYIVNAVVHNSLILDGALSQEEIEAMQSRAFPPSMWPWARGWWKPKDMRANLVRAGALIVAEIERLDRKEAAEKAVQP